MAAQDKTLRVLEVAAAAHGPLRLKDVVASTGLSKTTAFRLLQGLVDEDYLAKRDDGTFVRGTAMMVLGAVLSHPEEDEVIAVLADLQRRVNQTIHLAIHSGDHAIYTHKIEPAGQAVRMASRPGMLIALHTTAMGKAILSCLDESEVQDYAEATGLPPHTPHSLDSLRLLLADLRVTRERGWSLDDEENELTIRCIAVPVCSAAGRPKGAVSISTFAPLLSRERLLDFAEPLKEAAAKLSRLFSQSSQL